MPLRSIAFLMYFFGSSASAIMFPMAGVVCYIVLYHVYPQTTWWGKPLEFMGIRYAFICGICLIIGTALNLNRLPFGRRFFHPQEWILMLMLLCMVLSTAMGTQYSYRSEFLLDKIAKVFLFTFMMSHVVVTRQRIWQLTLVFTLMSLYLGHEAKTAPPGAFSHNRLDGIGGPDFRESAGLAIHLFALIPFVAVVLRQKRMWLKVVAFLAACYSINAILMCRARSAFLAGMIAGVLAIWYIPRRHRRWVILVLTIAAIGGIVLSDNWFWERMITIFSSAEERDRSAASRLQIWSAAYKLVMDNPWGVGIGQFRYAIGDYVKDQSLSNRDAHSSYVLCASELGILGLLVYVGAWLSAWRTLGRLNVTAQTRLANSDLFEMFIFANRLTLVVYAISGFFVSRLYTEGVWWFLVFPVCIERAIDNEIRSEVREEAALLNELRIRGHLEGPWPAAP